MGRIEPRGYRRWWPLISDGGLEEVEVEALRDQQQHGGRCSVVWTEWTGGDRWSGVHEWTVEAGQGIGLIFGRVFIPSADSGLCLQPSQGRLALGLPELCHAVPAPTGYTGPWLSLVMSDLMGHAVPGPMCLR
jgi:hypothetical protein